MAKHGHGGGHHGPNPNPAPAAPHDDKKGKKDAHHDSSNAGGGGWVKKGLGHLIEETAEVILVPIANSLVHNSVTGPILMRVMGDPHNDAARIAFRTALRTFISERFSSWPGMVEDRVANLATVLDKAIADAIIAKGSALKGHEVAQTATDAMKTELHADIEGLYIFDYRRKTLHLLSCTIPRKEDCRIINFLDYCEMRDDIAFEPHCCGDSTKRDVIKKDKAAAHAAPKKEAPKSLLSRTHNLLVQKKISDEEYNNFLEWVASIQQCIENPETTPDAEKLREQTKKCMRALNNELNEDDELIAVIQADTQTAIHLLSVAVEASKLTKLKEHVKDDFTGASSFLNSRAAEIKQQAPVDPATGRPQPPAPPQPPGILQKIGNVIVKLFTW